MPPPSIKNDGSQILQISLLLLLPLIYQSCSHSFYDIGVIFASGDSLKIVNNPYQAGETYHYRPANNVPGQRRNVFLLSADASCLFTGWKSSRPPSPFLRFPLQTLFSQTCRTEEQKRARLTRPPVPPCSTALALLCPLHTLLKLGAFL